MGRGRRGRAGARADDSVGALDASAAARLGHRARHAGRHQRAVWLLRPRRFREEGHGEARQVLPRVRAQARPRGHARGLRLPRPEHFHPLFGGNIDVPSYVAYQQTPLQTFWPVVLLYVGIVEIFSVFTFENPFGKGGFWSLKDDRVPGDFGWDPMDMYPTDPAGRVEMQTKELNNGRVAMFAVAGMVAQELATGAKLF